MSGLIHTGLGSSSIIAHVLYSPPPPPREQLCNRSCSNKHTHTRLDLCGVPILPRSRHTLLSEHHNKCPLQRVLVCVLYFPEQLVHPQYACGQARVGPGPVLSDNRRRGVTERPRLPRSRKGSGPAVKAARPALKASVCEPRLRELYIASLRAAPSRILCFLIVPEICGISAVAPTLSVFNR